MQIEQEKLVLTGPEIVFDCPACQRKNAAASTYDEEISESSGGIKLKDTTRSRVVCSECGFVLHSRVRAGELEGKSPAELADLIFRGASFAQKTLAVGAVLTAIIPVLGTIVGLTAFLVNRRVDGWPKTASLVGLIGSALPLFLCALGTVAAMLGWIN